MNATAAPGSGLRIARIIVRVVILAVLVAAVVWFITSLNAPRRQAAALLNDYADLCGGRPIPQAAPYVAGPGVHPVAVFGNDQDDPVGRGTEIRFPREVDPAVFNPSSPAVVQLVACADHVEDGPAIGTCPFNQVSATLHRASVEITVYEARTGEPVTEPVTVVADDTACPTVILYEGTRPKVFTKPTPQQFLAILKPLAQP